MGDIELEKWKHECNLQLEKWKEECHRQMEEWKNEQAWSLQKSGAADFSGQAALKSAILINGGAAAALLAFIGTGLNTRCDYQKSTAVYSMTCFILGVFLGAAATGVAFLCQFSYACNKNKIGNMLNYLSWVFVAISYLLFFVGYLIAVNIIL